MNKLPLESYYAYCPSYDLYVDSSNLLSIKINHGEWEQNSRIIVDIILDAPCTSTFITPRSVR